MHYKINVVCPICQRIVEFIPYQESNRSYNLETPSEIIAGMAFNEQDCPKCGSKIAIHLTIVVEKKRG